MILPITDEWPYKDAYQFMTPEMVWTAYCNEHRMRLLWEVQIKHCAQRIHSQRLEIKRLQKVKEVQS